MQKQSASLLHQPGEKGLLRLRKGRHHTPTPTVALLLEMPSPAVDPTSTWFPAATTGTEEITYWEELTVVHYSEERPQLGDVTRCRSLGDGTNFDPVAQVFQCR